MSRRRWLIVAGLLLSAGCGGSSIGPVAAPSAAASSSPSPVPVVSSAVKAGPVERIHETDEFGYVVAVTTAPVQVDVDRVDMLTGSAAEAAAAAHGDELESDYYLVNDSRRIRRYPVYADAVVWGSIRMNRHGPEHERMTLQRWLEFVRTDVGKQTLFHFDTEAGEVVGIEEQYLP